MHKSHLVLSFVFLVSLFFCFALKAVIVGNPAEPMLLNDGIFTNQKRQVTLRFGYYYEDIYKTKFKDEIINEEILTSPENNQISSPVIQLRTNGTILALNIKRFLEVYGLVGQSRLKIEEREADSSSTFYTQGNLSWGAGVKLTFFQYQGFSLGADGKYFSTTQEADYLVANMKYPALIETPILAEVNTSNSFAFVYEESQGSIALSYNMDVFTPYIGGTYLRASIMTQGKGFISFGFDPEDSRDMGSSQSYNINRWGLVLGVSIVSKEKIAVNVESRMVDQNSLNVSAEVSF